MAQDFTNGFDVKAKITERILSDLFEHVTPKAHSKTISYKGSSYDMEVYFHLLTPPKAPILGNVPLPIPPNRLPHIRLRAGSGTTTRVELHFPFRVMVRALGFEKVGEARVVIPAEPQLNDDTGVTTAHIEVRLSDVSPFDFDFELSTGTIYWYTTDPSLSWRANSLFPQELFEDEARPFIIQIIQALEDVSLTPTTTQLNFFNFRAYGQALHDSDDADATFEEHFLGVFANQRLGAPPPLPSTFGGPALPGSGYQNNLYTYVPRELVQPKLDEAAQTIIDESGGNIDSLAIGLRSGYILVSGTSAVADFSVQLTLEAIGDGADIELSANVESSDIDLDFWLDIIAPLPLHSLILDAIREGIREAISGAGSAVGETTKGVFDTKIEDVEGAALKVVISVTHKGPVTIRSGGLVIPGQIMVTLEPTDLAIPERVFAHRRSLEFHSAEYPHSGNKMAKANVVVFANPAEAIQRGFNGCVHCFPELHVDDLEYGFLEIHLRFPEPTQRPQTTVRLTRTEPITVGTITAKPVLQFTKESATPFFNPPQIVILPVEPFAGPWKIQISRGGWTAECEASIPARRQRRYVKIELDVGSSNCIVTQPSIPEGTQMAIGRIRISDV